MLLLQKCERSVCRSTCSLAGPYCFLYLHIICLTMAVPMQPECSCYFGQRSLPYAGFFTAIHFLIFLILSFSLLINFTIFCISLLLTEQAVHMGYNTNLEYKSPIQTNLAQINRCLLYGKNKNNSIRYF